MPWIKDEDGQPILVAKDSIENKLDDLKDKDFSATWTTLLIMSKCPSISIIAVGKIHV